MKLEILQNEMIAAMKAKDKPRKDAISSLVAAVKKAGIDRKCKDNIPEDLVNEVILKEKKTVQEMIDTCPTERQELLAEYKHRISVINEFAPQLLTDPAMIESRIKYILMENGTECSKHNKGNVMKVVMPELKGKADMKIVNQVIGRMLV